ncbi:unnamed protein product [Closterium sp. NIES-53]
MGEEEAGCGAQEESRGEAAGGEEIGGGEAAGGEERRGGWGRGERRGGCLVIPATPTPLPPPPHYSRGGKGREKEAVGAVCTFPPPPHPPPHSSRCGSEREAAEREVRGSWGLEHPLILSRQSHHPHLRVSTVAGCGREEGGERAGTGGGIHHLPCHSGNRAYNNNRPYTTYRASSCSLPPTRSRSLTMPPTIGVRWKPCSSFLGILRFDADSRALNFPTWLLRAELPSTQHTHEAAAAKESPVDAAAVATTVHPHNRHLHLLRHQTQLYQMPHRYHHPRQLQHDHHPHLIRHPCHPCYPHRLRHLHRPHYPYSSDAHPCCASC